MNFVSILESLAVIGAVIALIALIAGWTMNLFAFVGMLGDNTVTVMLVGRGIGIFVAPIGAILGWF